ncbi:nitrilase, partial [Streptomyces sp. NPDC005921]
MSTYRVNPAAPDEAYVAFWRERHLCTLTTLRPDGSRSRVPGVSWRACACTARSRSSMSRADSSRPAA